MSMDYGTWIPSYCYPGMDYERVQREVRAFSERANKHGIDLFVIDHLLHAPGLYGMPWMEPLTTLTYASAVAPDVRVGTGILVAPLRHPVLLAKEIATIDFLTGGRFINGLGPGWYPGEFAAVGNRLEERGRRTDEIIEALRLLLSEDNVSFSGRYYEFEDVTISPRPPKMPELWISGGSRIPDPEYTDPPVLAPTVLKRILKSDCWLSRCSGNQEFILNDIAQVRAALREAGRPEDDVRFGHCQFIYVADEHDREKALHIQQPYFEQVMGTHRDYEHLQQCYLLGSDDDIVARMRELKDHGMTYLLMGPVSDDPEQLDLIKERIIPRIEAD
jgi:alkanesulfonate monooxygenase SsuD/methylene tetrahydromethanopterin reductase-like flavin-dependent oxidoreductase (luciferase family)